MNTLNYEVTCCKILSILVSHYFLSLCFQIFFLDSTLFRNKFNLCSSFKVTDQAVLPSGTNRKQNNYISEAYNRLRKTIKSTLIGEFEDYSVHLFFALSLISPLNIFEFCFFKTHFNIIISLFLDLPSFSSLHIFQLNSFTSRL
jgi:hypothetical protein